MNPLLLPVGSDEVVCYYAPFEDLSGVKAILGATLTPGEQLRKMRYREGSASARFEFCRGALRVILARHLGLLPNEFEIIANEHGKPMLKHERGRELHFSLSHSRSHFAIALAHRPIGVDVEDTGREVDWMSVARRFFSEDEHRALAGLPDDIARRLFFRWWTAKEAVVKAEGFSLAGRIASLDLSRWIEDSPFDVQGNSSVLRVWSHDNGGAIFALSAPKNLVPRFNYAGLLICELARQFSIRAECHRNV